MPPRPRRRIRPGTRTKNHNFVNRMPCSATVAGTISQHRRQQGENRHSEARNATGNPRSGNRAGRPAESFQKPHSFQEARPAALEWRRVCRAGARRLSVRRGLPQRPYAAGRLVGAGLARRVLLRGQQGGQNCPDRGPVRKFRSQLAGHHRRQPGGGVRSSIHRVPGRLLSRSAHPGRVRLTPDRGRAPLRCGLCLHRQRL